MTYKREIISTSEAPAAVGSYSQAVKLNDLVFTAGQIPLVPETGQLIEGDIEAQTRQVITNLSKVLEAAGSHLENIVKTTIFVTDINDFAQVNAIYGSFFTNDPPARSTVQVAALPLGANIEIEAVAVVS